MLMKDIFEKIYKEIERANSIAIFCHINPDCDTMCSGLALLFALRKIGKNPEIFVDANNFSNKLKFLNGFENFQQPGKNVFDLAISVDSSDIGRIGKSSVSFLKARQRIAFDHHKSHIKFANIVALDTESASNSEIMFKFLKLRDLVDREIAELLFTGLVTDSGCFQFSNAMQSTHQTAIELMNYGILSHSIIYNYFRKKEKAVFDLQNRVLSKARFFEDEKIAIIAFTKNDFAETGTSSSNTEGIVSNLIDIDSVLVAFTLSEEGPLNWKLSVRTKAPVDASDIANTFGGGGHVRAAGARVNGYFEDIIEKLVKLARDRIIDL